MRTTVIVIGAIATIITIAFVASRRGLTSSGAEDHKASSVNKLAKREPRISRSEQLAFGRTQAQLGDLDEKLSELDGRLRAVEAAPDETVEGEATETVAAEQPANDPSTLSEVVLGEWMDRIAKAEPSNREWTAVAESEFREGLPKVPGVELDRIVCGKRFCRADLIVEGRSLVGMSDLLSLPVFESGAFTVPGEDGALAVYFTAKGVSTNDLRKEAWSEVQANGIEQ